MSIRPCSTIKTGGYKNLLEGGAKKEGLSEKGGAWYFVGIFLFSCKKIHFCEGVQVWKPGGFFQTYIFKKDSPQHEPYHLLEKKSYTPLKQYVLNF